MYNIITNIFQIAVPDAIEAAKEADILVFVVPHQFIPKLCTSLVGSIKPTAVGLSLIKVLPTKIYKFLIIVILFYLIKLLINYNLYILKGFDVAVGGGIDLISQIINRHLNIDVSVLMGANLANEIANEEFSETTIGIFFF